MREIKFSYIIQHNETKKFDNLIFDFSEIENGAGKALFMGSNLYSDYTVVAKRIYTGLKDKNGKEIYEWDIVKDKGRVRQIMWFDEGAQFISADVSPDSHEWDIMTCTTCGGDYEVIGNIYENPELLKP